MTDFLQQPAFGLDDLVGRIVESVDGRWSGGVTTQNRQVERGKIIASYLSHRDNVYIIIQLESGMTVETTLPSRYVRFV